MDTILINGNSYQYYINYKLRMKQIKRVKEKIRATKTGCYKDYVTKKGEPYYKDYPELLIFLEGLIEKC